MNLSSRTETVAPEISEHSRLTALLLCWPFGFFGAHRVYVGKSGTGLLQLVTLGGFQFWTLIDFVFILSGAFTDGSGRSVKRWTWQGAELHQFPILIVAAATSVLAGIWVGVIARWAAPSFAEVAWPLVGVQAAGGLAMGLAVQSNRFLHAVVASVVGSYLTYLVVIVVGLVVSGGDGAEGVGFAAIFIAGLLYLITPVVGLLSLVGGAVDTQTEA